MLLLLEALKAPGSGERGLQRQKRKRTRAVEADELGQESLGEASFLDFAEVSVRGTEGGAKKSKAFVVSCLPSCLGLKRVNVKRLSPDALRTSQDSVGGLCLSVLFGSL